MTSTPHLAGTARAQALPADPQPTAIVSVVVCTRNRPVQLAECLASLRRSSFPVAEVIVSDDGSGPGTRDVLDHCDELTTWTQGPRRGLGPNRNHALTLVTGTHVLFLDDDATLGQEFLAAAIRRLRVAGAPFDKTIVTGVELRPDGHRVVAHEQDFLGYQHRPYRNGEQLKTVVINSALFPRDLFSTIAFDEQLVYGYDEVDLTSRAVKLGYSIVSADDAVNGHDPSEINRDYYRPRVDAARLYVTAKRRWVTERSPLRASAFLSVAVAHLFLHAVGRRRQAPRRTPAGRVALEALTMLRRHLRPAWP